jgi:hypothetical protein
MNTILIFHTSKSKIIAAFVISDVFQKREATSYGGSFYCGGG